MLKQPFLVLSILLSGFFPAHAKPPTLQTYQVPSPKNEKKEEIKNQNNEQRYLDQGLDTSYTPTTPPRTFTYHLPPQPSFTLLLSRIYDFAAQESDGWIGFHASPYVKPTSRWQYGVDARKGFGWLQAYWHILPTRNLSRFYWGPGFSIIVDFDKELRSFLKIDNYYLAGVGGWEFQLQPQQNIRLEASFHQGVDRGFVKFALGYTILL